MALLSPYQCNALIVAFMKLNPFPWKSTIKCLDSLLKYPYDMKEFHHSMHVHGNTLFNYWRDYIRRHALDDEQKEIVTTHLFDNKRERYRAVWMLREDGKWSKLRESKDWYDNYEACMSACEDDPPPTIDYPDSRVPKDMEVILTVESKCSECTEKCTCQLPVRCPINNIYDIPYGFEGEVKMLTTKAGLTFAYTHTSLENSEIQHYVINGVHILKDAGKHYPAGEPRDYYIATYDEWFKSKEHCAILAFEDFLKESRCQCWNECCPCNVQ